MIISIVQHDGANFIEATPQNGRDLHVKRRLKHWRCEWGGWHRRSLDEKFPEGFELRRDRLLAGTWAGLKPRTIGVPFDSYVYQHNADGTRFEVDGSGVLLGAHLTGLAAGGRAIERVYLVISEEGHYYHAPDFERRPKGIPFPKIEDSKPVVPTRVSDSRLHRLNDDAFGSQFDSFQYPYFILPS